MGRAMCAMSSPFRISCTLAKRVCRRTHPSHNLSTNRVSYGLSVAKYVSRVRCPVRRKTSVRKRGARLRSVGKCSIELLVQGLGWQPFGTGGNMSKEWDILVASANLEHRRSLIRILEELPVNVISVSTFQQAEEVLSRQHIALVFSDHRLPDGSFRVILNHVHSAGLTPPIVLTKGVRISFDPKEIKECSMCCSF